MSSQPQFPKRDWSRLNYGKPGEGQISHETYDIFDCDSATPSIVRVGISSLEGAEEIARKCVGKNRLVIVKNSQEAKIVRIVNTR